MAERETEVVVVELPALAVKREAAARLLGISAKQLWRRVNLPAGDPRRIARTSYGTYPVAELHRHLAAELAAVR